MIAAMRVWLERLWSVRIHDLCPFLPLSFLCVCV